MSTIVHRDTPSLISELMSRMGATSDEPDIRVEEYVEDDRLVIRADLPGVDPEKDIAVTVESGRLRIRGQRRAEEHAERRTEIRYGTFERVLSLPSGTAASDVTAAYRDGVLTVSLPTSKHEEPHEVPVTR